MYAAVRASAAAFLDGVRDALSLHRPQGKILLHMAICAGSGTEAIYSENRYSARLAGNLLQLRGCLGSNSSAVSYSDFVPRND